MSHDSHQPNVRTDQLVENLANTKSETDLFSKEVILLASGLLFLTLGIGGVLLYSEDQPLHANSTKTVNIKHVSEAFHSPAQVALSNKESATQPPTATLVSYKEEGEPSEVTRSLEETDVYFGFDKSGLSEEAKNVLQATAARLGEGQSWGATIQGHTDSKGSNNYNQALALRRAQAVKNYLMTIGAQESSIHIESLSSKDNICTEDSEECHQQNRRAHVTFARVEPTPVSEAPLISESLPTESENIMTAELPSTSSRFEDEGPTTMASLEQANKESEVSDPKSSIKTLP